MILGPIAKSPREVRVWVGEVPWHLATGGPITAMLPCTASPKTERETSLAVEMKIDMSPSFIYGLLGGTFRGDKSGTFEPSMWVTETKEGVFHDSLMRSFDLVHWTFPREFAEAALKAVTRQTHRPSGMLEINCAACSRIGSNQVIFACLAQVLMLAISERLEAPQIVDAAFAQKISDALAMLTEAGDTHDG